MAEKIMPANQALQLHFSNIRDGGNFWFFSGFIAALRDARSATARDPDTGEKFAGNHGNWLGTVGYLILLDQIGKCFKPKRIEVIPEGNPIRVALTLFSDLQSLEIDAIYALRCSFAHDFSLFNIPQSGKETLYHFFLVDQGPNGPIVKLPEERWDGNHENKKHTNQTYVNLELLGDLVERICSELRRLSEQNELDVTLPDGSDELIYRYSFWSKKG